MGKTSYKQENYWKPTPKKIRKLADAIGGACVFAGGLTSLSGHAIVGTVIFTAGFLAKILSNFFAEEGTTQG
jgi:hypothetical protein